MVPSKRCPLSTGLQPKEDTMLERFFKTDSTPRRLRKGPVGPFFAGFAESMFAGGYASMTVGPHLHAADHLAQWAARRAAILRDEPAQKATHRRRQHSRPTPARVDGCIDEGADAAAGEIPSTRPTRRRAEGLDRYAQLRHRQPMNTTTKWSRRSA
jgi:hypothetical protein